MGFSHCLLWPPTTKEYVHIGSTHQLHTAEYKQKKKEDNLIYKVLKFLMFYPKEFLIISKLSA